MSKWKDTVEKFAVAVVVGHLARVRPFGRSSAVEKCWLAPFLFRIVRKTLCHWGRFDTSKQTCKRGLFSFPLYSYWNVFHSQKISSFKKYTYFNFCWSLRLAFLLNCSLLYSACGRQISWGMQQRIWIQERQLCYPEKVKKEAHHNRGVLAPLTWFHSFQSLFSLFLPTQKLTVYGFCSKRFFFYNKKMETMLRKKMCWILFYM